MSFSKVSLLQIPDIPMEHILQFLEFPSILVLRKVCHDFRKFIDNTKPASGLTQIRIIVERECIQFHVSFKCYSSNTTSEKKYYIDYKKSGEGCLIKCYSDKNNETILENEDFIEVFCKDFNIFLRHQKTILEDFGIFFEISSSTIRGRILESVEKSLKSMIHPLQVKKLEMKVSSHEEIMSILPYVDPNSIKTIQLTDAFSVYNVMNFDKIGQLEQWKQAKELEVQGFKFIELARNAKQFSRITIYFLTVSSDSLILLKEIFFSSPTLNTIKLDYKLRCCRGIGSLIETFGQSFVGPRQDENWFFAIPDTNQILKIQHNYVDICFQRIEQSDVPQSARIQN